MSTQREHLKADLRDEMIAVLETETSKRTGHPTCPEIADAILELLGRWDAGSEVE